MEARIIGGGWWRCQMRSFMTPWCDAGKSVAHIGMRDTDVERYWQCLAVDVFALGDAQVVQWMRKLACNF
jgi:hypothetical protein